MKLDTGLEGFIAKSYQSGTLSEGRAATFDGKRGFPKPANRGGKRREEPGF